MSMDKRRKWQLTCREAAALMLQSRDRKLGWRERAALRVHLWICPPCPKFAAQLKLLDQAMGHWRQYRDAEK